MSFPLPPKSKLGFLSSSIAKLVGKVNGFSIGDPLMSCTSLQKAAKAVWAKQLTQPIGLVTFVNCK